MVVNDILLCTRDYSRNAKLYFLVQKQTQQKTDCRLQPLLLVSQVLSWAYETQREKMYLLMCAPNKDSN